MINDNFTLPNYRLDLSITVHIFKFHVYIVSRRHRFYIEHTLSAEPLPCLWIVQINFNLSLTYVLSFFNSNCKNWIRSKLNQD